MPNRKSCRTRERAAPITHELVSEFKEAVSRGRELDSPFSNFLDADAALLLSLAKCTAIMPKETCEALIVPQGSSYAYGARELARWLAAQQCRCAAA